MVEKTVNVDELHEMIKSGEVCLIDVREPAEYRTVHIENSILNSSSAISVDNLPQTSHPIVLICSTGSRSNSSCKKLLELNPSLNVHTLIGGIGAWEKSGYKVMRSTNSKVLPLDRQTQIAAGTLALSGTLLGTFVDPKFYILPGFVGSGLIFAGISGWCGMAKLLAKMPWNT